MRVFVAGATGVIGRPLVQQLIEAGHTVVALSRTPERAAAVQELGATVVAGDVLDRDGIRTIVRAASPDVVVHQATALQAVKDIRRFDQEFAATNRLRSEGTDNLLDAAVAAGARRFIAQSFTNWPNDPRGAAVQTESDALDPSPPASQRRSLDAILHLERRVVDARGIEAFALRYGNLYGPGTGFASDGGYVAAIRKRMLPIVGDGSGIWSFVHVADAAAATVKALTTGTPGVYNVTDDEPAAVATWLPVLAFASGAKPPRHVPVWLARWLIGEAGVSMMTRSKGSSNAKAKQGLGWQPRYASWRTGFVSELKAVGSNLGKQTKADALRGAASA